MNKLISANYWFGCDWWFCEVGYLGMRADQLSLACAGVYLWNTGHLRVTDPRMCSGFQQGDHPELDTSELCDDHQTKQFQTLIGQLQWLI